MDTPVKTKPGWLTRRRFLLASGIGLAAAGVDAVAVEPTNLKVVHRRLTTGKPSHRFVHFTDLHYKGDRDYAAKVVRTINSFSPEFVCFTGDIVEHAPYLGEAFSFIQQIKAPIYAVPGNHEYKSGVHFKDVEAGFVEFGGAWLPNRELAVCEGKINLIGLPCQKPARLLPPRSGMMNILLLHFPLWTEDFGRVKYDLVLAGHSHGGQVRLPGIGPIFVPPAVGRYDYGIYQCPLGPLHVSSGIGCIGRNIRFNCPPEIVVYEV